MAENHQAIPTLWGASSRMPDVTAVWLRASSGYLYAFLVPEESEEPMSYEAAIEMLARQMDLCERLEAGRSPWTFEHQDRARAEGRYATQVVSRLTGKSYAAVRNDVVQALKRDRLARGAERPAGSVSAWDRLGT